MSNVAPVIYVEDDPDDAHFMRYAFAEARISVPLVVLTDGKQALDYLTGRGDFVDRSQHPLPCLLLLDLTLPIKSGFEVLRWIREHPTLKELKVVVVSSSNLDLDIRIADELGVLDYIVKPSTPLLMTAYIQEGMKRWLP